MMILLMISSLFFGSANATTYYRCDLDQSKYVFAKEDHKAYVKAFGDMIFEVNSDLVWGSYERSEIDSSELIKNSFSGAPSLTFVMTAKGGMLMQLSCSPQNEKFLWVGDETVYLKSGQYETTKVLDDKMLQQKENNDFYKLRNSCVVGDMNATYQRLLKNIDAVTYNATLSNNKITITEYDSLCVEQGYIKSTDPDRASYYGCIKWEKSIKEVRVISSCSV